MPGRSSAFREFRTAPATPSREVRRLPWRGEAEKFMVTLPARQPTRWCRRLDARAGSSSEVPLRVVELCRPGLPAGGSTLPSHRRVLGEDLGTSPGQSGTRLDAGAG